jgi:Phage tail sheath protein subtilisin-like domain/Phage tail sheath C-terminal domain
MPFQLSPGVAVVEKDFSSIVPAVSSSRGAFAGAFAWGPVLAPTSVTSENELVRIFGKPQDANAQAFFTAANFLSYTNSLLISRADTGTQRNAVAIQTGGVSAITLSNNGSGYTSVPTVSIAPPSDPSGTQAVAVARLSGGGVTGVTVSAGGSGYTTGSIVTFSSPQIAGGVAPTAHVTVSGGAITGIVIDTAGTGYTAPPTVTVGGGAGFAAGTVSISSSTVTGIQITTAGTGYSAIPAVAISAPVSGVTAQASATIAQGGVKINNTNDYLMSFSHGEGVNGEWAARFPGSLGNSLLVSMADSASFATWAYKANFDSAPSTSTYTDNVLGSNDELHVVVVDEDGLWTGTPGTVLEKFAFLSKASDCKKSDGTNNYYKDAINNGSQYIYWLDHNVTGTNWGTTSAGTSFVTLGSAVTRSLSGGVDNLTATDGQLETAYSLFADDAQYDISLVLMGKADATVVDYVIGNVAETRLDCVVFASAQDVDTGEPIIGTGSAATDKMVAYRNVLPSTSYAVLDSGFKYQYDRYNDKYRWVPLNGDTAGLCARTDYTNDPWFSPGGLNRGQIKNVVKLALNPTKADRDVLYKAGINPVVTFPGEGTVLFGDKTLLAKPSAFDRINVRRLFIVMEKAIATAAKYQLFEFNDPFTRAQFKNLIEPFLRDIQGRRGITDFAVKCDESNNTGQVIDSNNFVADIFVKPNRSINFITLNFVAARSSISFSELGA